MSEKLDADTAFILTLLPKTNWETETPQGFRETMRAMAAARAVALPPAVASVADVEVKGAAGPLPARVYRPSAEAGSTIAFFHGGGWVAGDLETSDRVARLLAIQTGAVVVSVDYRRPPETRFPGAFEDGVAAARDIAARIGEFGKNPSKLGVAGDSAGGNLAAATALAFRDLGLPLAAQLLIYPVTEITGLYADANENARFPSRRENATDYFLTTAMMAWFAHHYADIEASSDWRASPLRATSLAGVAPAVVSTAYFDPLRDEGGAYAEALAAAGVETYRHHGPGLIHGYFGMVDASGAARAEASRVRADFKALLDRGVG